jgi:hypothetical protein
MRSLILKYIDAKLIRIGRSPVRSILQFLFAILLLASICTLGTYALGHM